MAQREITWPDNDLPMMIVHILPFEKGAHLWAIRPKADPASTELLVITVVSSASQRA
jgi:hypothetical protein